MTRFDQPPINTWSAGHQMAFAMAVYTTRIDAVTSAAAQARLERS